MSEWISVKDRFPSETAEVLAISKSVHRFGQTIICKYDKLDKNFKYIDGGVEYIIGVSHYMLLPEPPKEKEKKQYYFDGEEIKVASDYIKNLVNADNLEGFKKIKIIFNSLEEARTAGLNYLTEKSAHIFNKLLVSYTKLKEERENEKSS